MSYPLIVFDFDGTLADSYPFFMRNFNALADAHGFRRIAAGESEALRGLDAAGVMREVGLPLWRFPRVARDFRALMAERIDEVSLFPGVAAMLETLVRRGHSLAILTSNSERNARAVLRDHAGLITRYACGASLFGKCHRLAALGRTLRVQASEILYVGDELRDAQAARRAEMAFGAVAWGYTRFESLLAASPDWAFERVEDITVRLPPLSGRTGRVA